MELNVCHRENCSPVYEAEYGQIHCKNCGLGGGLGHTEEQAVARWNAEVSRYNDIIFRDEAIHQLQMQHNSKPFFIGKPKEGFWVKEGKKYEEYPG